MQSPQAPPESLEHGLSSKSVDFLLKEVLEVLARVEKKLDVVRSEVTSLEDSLSEMTETSLNQEEE